MLDFFSSMLWHCWLGNRKAVQHVNIWVGLLVVTIWLELFQHTFVVWRTAPLHLDDYLRLICFLSAGFWVHFNIVLLTYLLLSTSVYSALGVSVIIHYINRCFTYLLTAHLIYI